LGEFELPLVLFLKEFGTWWASERLALSSKAHLLHHPFSRSPSLRRGFDAKQVGRDTRNVLAINRKFKIVTFLLRARRNR
jgi:hypothetical protein